MKKVLLLALCLTLAGLLAVNGTFAADFTQALSEAIETLFQKVENIASPAPTTDPAFDVSLVYLDGRTDPPMLSPGSTVERNIAVANGQNSSPAYFCIAFAVQEEASSHLELTFNNTADYTWSDWRDITIGDDQQKYKLKIGTYTKALDKGAKSSPALESVYMKPDTTSADMASIDPDFLQIQVLAICADDFTGSAYESAEAALNQALPIDSQDFNPFK